MKDVSVIIPSLNEPFLNRTIKDVIEKATANTEVIAILDGWWPDDIIDDNRVHYIHFTERRGLRGGINAGVAISRAQFVMKLDAHCMVSEGFDTVLAETCENDWVCVPTRHRLDAENWRIDNGGRPPINYLRIDPLNDGVNVLSWDEKNRDRSLDAIEVDDIIGCQGSCFFLPRDYYHWLELLDEENYGTFRKDPQEVMFKAWLSGGRCVRVKRCWYAHLHKGKKYGRGYKVDKEDWKKGDEYVKKWFTEERAWHKQTLPMSWLLDRFQMPGWEIGWEAQEKKEEKVEEAVKMGIKAGPGLPKLYQVLTVDGKPFTRPNDKRTKSRFWNEGRWHNFIEPLLPKDATDMTFVEMGADAGLYLKMASDYGFRRVVGIEKNKTPVRFGLEWRDAIGGDWTLLKRTLGGGFGEEGTFSIDELPIADVTLMSTFHYYVDINAWLKYLDRLRSKTCMVIVVGRPDWKNEHWMAKADYVSVQGYFREWEEVCHIDNIPLEGDPGARSLYSVLFRSPLIKRIPMDAIDPREDASDPMHAAMIDLALRIASREPFDQMETAYAEQWRKRKHGEWSEKTLRRWVDLKVGVLTSIRDDGIRDPIVVQKNEKLSDGGHRLVMLKALGYQSAIVRPV